MFQKIAEFILQERFRELENRVAELENILRLVESYESKHSKKKYPTPPIVKRPPTKVYKDI